MKKILIGIMILLAISMIFVSCNSEVVENNDVTQVSFSLNKDADNSKALSTGSGEQAENFSSIVDFKIKLKPLSGTGFCSLNGALDGFVDWPTAAVSLGRGNWIVYAEGFKDGVKYYENADGIKFTVGAAGVSLDGGQHWGTNVPISMSYCYSGKATIKVNTDLVVKNESGDVISLGNGIYSNYKIEWFKTSTPSPVHLTNASTVSDLIKEGTDFVKWENPGVAIEADGCTFVIAVLVSNDPQDGIIYGSSICMIGELADGYNYLIGSGENDYVAFGDSNVFFENPVIHSKIWKVIKAPGILTEGLEQLICSECGAIYDSREIEPVSGTGSWVGTNKDLNYSYILNITEEDFVTVAAHVEDSAGVTEYVVLNSRIRDINLNNDGPYLGTCVFENGYTVVIVGEDSDGLTLLLNELNSNNKSDFHFKRVSEEPHNHTYSTATKVDEQYHSFTTTCTEHGAYTVISEHSFKDSVCTVCNCEDVQPVDAGDAEKTNVENLVRNIYEKVGEVIQDHGEAIEGFDPDLSLVRWTASAVFLPDEDGKVPFDYEDSEYRIKNYSVNLGHGISEITALFEIEGLDGVSQVRMKYNNADELLFSTDGGQNYLGKKDLNCYYILSRAFGMGLAHSRYTVESLSYTDENVVLSGNGCLVIDYAETYVDTYRNEGDLSSNFEYNYESEQEQKYGIQGSFTATTLWFGKIKIDLEITNINGYLNYNGESSQHHSHGNNRYEDSYNSNSSTTLTIESGELDINVSYSGNTISAIVSFLDTISYSETRHYSNSSLNYYDAQTQSWNYSNDADDSIDSLSAEGNLGIALYVADNQNNSARYSGSVSLKDYDLEKANNIDEQAIYDLFEVFDIAGMVKHFGGTYTHGTSEINGKRIKLDSMLSCFYDVLASTMDSQEQ